MDVFIYLWSTRKNYVVYCFVFIEKKKVKPSTNGKKKKRKLACARNWMQVKERKKEKKKESKAF